MGNNSIPSTWDTLKIEAVFKGGPYRGSIISHSYFKLLLALEENPPIWALTELFISHNDVIESDLKY